MDKKPKELKRKTGFKTRTPEQKAERMEKSI